mgnify:CR=1 FL=1
MIKELTTLEKCAISYMVYSGCKDRNIIYQLAHNPDKFNKLSSNSKAVTVSRWFNRHEIQEFINKECGNVVLSVDGRSQVLSQDLQLHIERSQRTIKLVRINGQTFMQSLKDKLHWGK